MPESTAVRSNLPLSKINQSVPGAAGDPHGYRADGVRHVIYRLYATNLGRRVRIRAVA